MYQHYADCSDEELILRIRDGEEHVIDYLIEKYKDLVRGKTKSMYILGADHDDLLQEGMIGLFKAIRDYDLGRDASFKTFANLCITRQVYTAIRSAKRNSQSFLNYYVSLYEEVEYGKEGEGLYTDVAQDALDPEAMVIDQESAKALEERLDRELSNLEKEVLDLCVVGMNYVEIAKVLGISEKSADNAMQRMKQKVKKMIAEKR